MARTQYKEFNMTALQGADYTLMAVVKRRANTINQFVLGSETSAADALYVGYNTNTQVDARNSSSATASTAVSGYNVPQVGPSLVTVNYNSSNLDLNEFRDGVISSNTTATSTDYAATGYLGNLGRALGGNYFNGDVVEVIGFSSNLSSGDYNALSSQLAIKYGIDLGADYVDDQANLLWDFSDNAGYQNDVLAIGYDASFDLDQKISRNESDSLVLSTSVDFSSLNSQASRASLSDGQFVFVSNDNDPYTMNQTFNGNANSRLDRTWRVREVGSPGDVVVSLPPSLTAATVMLVSADPTFGTGVSQVAVATVGGRKIATHDFADGDYFTFAIDGSEIWYSYTSGNWNDPANWTLDGALSALYVNPNGKFPAAGDSVVIKSARTITMNVDYVEVADVEITGTLDLGGTQGHNFTTITGTGRMRLSGVSGVENYPSGTDVLFYDQTEGGIYEIYGSGLTISTKRRAKDLQINLTSSSDQVVFTGDSLIVKNALTISSGLLKINDDLSTTSKVVKVSGDAVVASNGGIRVGTANARHEFDLYGDFVNQGISYFTNRTTQNTGSESAIGIVDFNLKSSTQDQDIDLQNVTRFYRIEINKGVDDTYVAYFHADNASYFNLFGYANNGIDAAQQTTNSNALGLIFGTIRVGENVTIAPLNAGGNYSIFEGTQLWVDGGTVSKTGGTAIVPYGKIRVTAGLLSAPINSGITTRNNGQLTLEGGTVTIRQFRTSILGASAQGGLIMSGGILNITGGAVSDNYYTMSLTYPGNVFNMSGGTINLSGVNDKGGIYINSSDENISVTGGTVNLTSTNANNLTITSRAPFYNLNVLRASGGGTGVVQVSAGTSGTGGGQTSLTPVGLSIINDLKIDNTGGFGTQFSANNFDVNIIGELIVQSGATANFTGMELTFEGDGASALDIQTGTTFTVDTLVLNKNLSIVDLDIINGAATAVTVNNLLEIQNGNFDLGTFNVALKGNIILNDTIGKSTSAGRLLVNGTVAQTITSTSGVVYDMTIDNSTGVSLTGALAVIDDFNINTGIFNIGTYKLTCIRLFKLLVFLAMRSWCKRQEMPPMVDWNITLMALQPIQHLFCIQ